MRVPFGFVPGQGGQCNSLHTSLNSHTALRAIKEPEWAARVGALWRRSELWALGASNKGVHFDTAGTGDWHFNTSVWRIDGPLAMYFFFLYIFWRLSELPISIQQKRELLLNLSTNQSAEPSTHIWVPEGSVEGEAGAETRQ